MEQKTLMLEKIVKKKCIEGVIDLSKVGQDNAYYHLASDRVVDEQDLK